MLALMISENVPTAVIAQASGVKGTCGACNVTEPLGDPGRYILNARKQAMAPSLVFPYDSKWREVSRGIRHPGLLETQ
jgi:hypothetical protein